MDRPTFSVGGMECSCCEWFCSPREKSNSFEVDAICSLEQHNTEIHQNRRSWLRKALLREIYKGFHRRIAGACRQDLPQPTVEIGSGLGQIKSVIPKCITTDVFPNPWLDRTENAYRLTFGDSSIANLILFDVWHHLRYPGTALLEFKRVLALGGRLIVFDPCMSFLGVLVYGLFHHEPLGLRDPITWFAESGTDPALADYYASAANGWRTFCCAEGPDLEDWRVIEIRRSAALSYVASGGFRGPQLYPYKLFPLLQCIDAVL